MDSFMKKLMEKAAAIQPGANTSYAHGVGRAPSAGAPQSRKRNPHLGGVVNLNLGKNNSGISNSTPAVIKTKAVPKATIKDIKPNAYQSALRAAKKSGGKGGDAWKSLVARRKGGEKVNSGNWGQGKSPSAAPPKDMAEKQRKRSAVAVGDTSKTKKAPKTIGDRQMERAEVASGGKRGINMMDDVKDTTFKPTYDMEAEVKARASDNKLLAQAKADSANDRAMSKTQLKRSNFATGGSKRKERPGGSSPENFPVRGSMARKLKDEKAQGKNYAENQRIAKAKAADWKRRGQRAAKKNPPLVAGK